jgi:hypothetical protein
MTAEIAILNKTAVALAADSAITVSSKSGRNKIYQTANKILALDYQTPVGVMIYNSSELMGIPWEVLIKEYRVKNSKELPTLSDYWDSIKEYLAHLPPNVFYDFKSYFYGHLLDISKFLSQKPSTSDIPDRTKIITNIVSLIDQQPKLAELFPDHLREEWQILASEVFDQFQWDDSREETKVRPTREEFLLITSHLADHIFSGTGIVTGVVLAGFGAEQVFPEVLTYSVENIFKGFLRYTYEENNSGKISHQTTYSRIFPFAQSDVVQNFIGGIDSKHIGHVYGLFSKLLHEFVNQLNVSDDVRSFSHQTAETLSADFLKQWYEYQRQVYISPIVDAVASLSKDQLAVMAETLVELTAFKRRFDMGAEETVGGPIDVAVISKGDGLIWIKRKHYFDPKLNLHFVQKYFGDKV